MSAPTCPFCGHVSYDAEPVHVGNSASAAEVIDAAINVLVGRRWQDTCAPDARQTMRWRVGKVVGTVIRILPYYRKGRGDAPAESLTLSLAAELGRALSERNAVMVERDEARVVAAKAKAAVQHVAERAVYGNSYGVHGSDFTCCMMCQGGGAPGIAFKHDDDCPIIRCEAEAEVQYMDWFAENEAATEAEARATALAARVEQLEGALRDVIDGHGCQPGYITTLGLARACAALSGGADAKR